MQPSVRARMRFGGDPVRRSAAQRAQGQAPRRRRLPPIRSGAEWLGPGDWTGAKLREAQLRSSAANEVPDALVSTPSNSATVAPQSANVALVPRSTPVDTLSPAHNRGTCSRE